MTTITITTAFPISKLSRQTKSVLAKSGRPDRSPVSKKRDVDIGNGGDNSAAQQQSAVAPASFKTPTSNVGATSSLDSAAAASVNGEKGGEVGEEGDSVSSVVGGCGHLTKLVLKFTTASESDVQPSCEVS